MKVIKSLKNSIKRNYCKNSYSQFSQAINYNWFTINAKCTYSISQKCYSSIRIISKNIRSRFKKFTQEIIYSEIKDGAYIINPDEYESIRIHWNALSGNTKNITYKIFRVKRILKEIRKFISNKNIITSTHFNSVWVSSLCRIY